MSGDDGDYSEVWVSEVWVCRYQVVMKTVVKCA